MEKLLRRGKIIHVVSQIAVRVKQKQKPNIIGKWLARECQHLGPTYIKIGQFISSRKDVFGAEFSSAFDSLRDDVLPIDNTVTDKIIDTLEKQNGMVIQKKHIASASIGQVHRGKDKHNNDIIVKVRRPNIYDTLTEDLMFLKWMVKCLIMLGFYNAQNTYKMLNEFEDCLLQEIDFKREASNLKAFYKMYSLKYESLVKIPYVVSELCTSDLVVMDYIENIGFDQYKGDNKTLAYSLMSFFIEQLTEYGMIHGDPHQGNIGITADGKLILYDYGSVITIKPNERYILKELVYMLIIGNKEGIIKLLPKIGVEVTNQELLSEYLDKYMEYMKTIDINVFKGLNHTGNMELPLKLNGKVFRLLRVYGILEGICKELDPSFNYFDLLDNYITNLILDDDFITYKIQQDMVLVQNNLKRLMSYLIKEN